MQLSENIMSAFRNVFSNKMRTFLTMLGIIIGIAAVIGVFIRPRAFTAFQGYGIVIDGHIAVLNQYVAAYIDIDGVTARRFYRSGGKIWRFSNLMLLQR